MSTADDIINLLRERGDRVTMQRRLVIDALSATKAHMTISQIQAYITENEPHLEIPEPTIYRILQWLKSLHIISQTDIGADGLVYQVIGQRPHHHLICLNCGKTIDISDEHFDALRRDLRQRYGFEPRIDHMAIYGICADCEA